MKNLDWKKINNDRDFQRLVNDLFASEINKPDYLSSSPEIGADGGWDGRYKGTFMGFDGVWSFQAKWTKHNLDEAYKQLCGEIKNELEKAQKNKVQYLLLATNADLRVGTDDHIGKLEKLNDKKLVKRLFIWPRANLESKIKQHLQLRHDYFNDPQEPMFVPPHIFAESEPLLGGVLIGREKSIKVLSNFIDDSKSNILIIHSGGGYGKTHFIVEAGKRCNSLQPNFQIWFCRPGIRDVNEAINELNHEKDTLVFLDDAERYLEDAKKVIAHTKTFSPGKLKVILSCRSSGKEIVRNLANAQGIDAFQEFELPQLTEKELIEILNRAADSKTIKHPERIVKELTGNLFLIVTIGKLIRGGEFDPKQIKKQIKEGLDREAINALSQLLSDREVKKLLRELSIIVPFSRDRNSVVIEKLSNVLGLDVKILNECLTKLIEAKILRTVGASIRFNPDMKGDIYLSVELDKQDGKEQVNQIFENWLSVYPKQLTANLAAALRHRETDLASEAIKELLKKWINETSETSELLKSRRLELVTPIAFLSPEDTINLIYAYIDSSSTESIHSPNRDTYGPVIYQILHIPGYEEIILKLILYIDKKDLKGTYDNYTSISLIKNITSPIQVNIYSAIKTLSVLSEWTKKEDCIEIEAKLASEGVKEALSGSHEYNDSYGHQLTWGRRILRYEKPFKESVDQFRDKGIEVLKNLINHPNDKIKKIGIEVVDDIGHDATSTSNDFWERILSDKAEAIKWLEELVGKTKSHEVLSSIEDVLVRYWANNNIYQDLSGKAADILKGYPRSIEYIIFRYFVAHDLIIADSSIIESGACKSNRWSWLVHNHFRLRGFRQKDFDNVVEQLAKKYKGTEKIIEYLVALEKNIQGIAQWQYIPLIETWSRFNEEPFIKIANDKSLLVQIPERYHLGIFIVASDKDKKYVSKYAQEILSDIKNLQIQSVSNLLDLISRHSLPVDEFLPWLLTIIENSDSNIKSLILHRVYFVFKDRNQIEKSKIIDILELSLGGVVDSRMLDMFSFLLRHAIQWNLPSDDFQKIRTRLFEIIKNVPSIDYHADELLKFVVNGDLNKFIELVEYRLNKFKDSIDREDREHFDPIPYDGFRSSGELIENYTDFSQLMDKINFWRREELLYSFDIDNLLKNFKNRDDDHGDYLHHYIGEKIKKGGTENLKTATNALYGIPFGEGTADLFLSLLLSAEKAGIIDSAKEVFTHQVIGGSYSSSVGEAPPALVNKKKALEEMHKKCPPGNIKNYIDTRIKSISDDIKRHVNEGKELMNPKH